MGFKTRVALALVLLLALVFHAYVRIFATVAYTYLYWGLLPKHINWIGEAREQQVQRGELDLPVPKLIHQTWIDHNVPEKWQAAQKSCIEAHTGKNANYTYKLWTDEEGLELIRDEYPWFLPTYQAYPYSIQRVDAVRYFILHKFGGIYIDLDMGCNRELAFMREYGFTAPLTYPIGISNDVMAAQPGNAYLERVIHRLQYWNHWLFIKYIQVMFTTGPMFLTGQYAVGGQAAREGVGVIDGPLYGKYDFSGDAAFYHLHGSSWHADDAQFIFLLDRLRQHWMVLIGVAFVLVGGWAWWRKYRSRGLGRQGDGALAEMLPLVERHNKDKSLRD